MIENEVHREILQLAIQSLTFSYCITVPDLYEVVQKKENAFAYISNRNIEGHKYENEKSIRRIKNILLRVIKANENLDNSTNNLDYISAPKIYDDALYDAQIQVYNTAAQLAGFDSIDPESILSPKFIKNALSLDGEMNDQALKNLSRMCPYYIHGKRTKFNFIEYILLLSINLITHGRSVNVINQPLTDRKTKARARKWINEVIQSIKSPDLYSVYLDIFFKVLDRTFADIYNEYANDYTRTVLLPDKYKNVKNAVDCYHKYVHGRSYPSRRTLEHIVDEHYEKNYFFADLFTEKYNDALEFDINEIIPLSYGLLAGTLPDLRGSLFEGQLISNELTEEQINIIETNIERIINKIHLERCCYSTQEDRVIIRDAYVEAHNLSFIFKSYIDEAITAAQKLLQVFEEYKAIGISE